MNQAVFWVTPSARPTSYELIPFFALTISQIAGSHLLKGSGLSANNVPIFTVNCFLQSLQLLTMRLPENVPTFAEPQWAHFGFPSGQTIAAMKV